MLDLKALDAGKTTASLYLYCVRQGYPLPTSDDPPYRDWIKPKGDGS